MQTMRSIIKQALAQNPKLTNRDLRNIVATTLNRTILYNLSGTMVKQERNRVNNILLFVYGTLMKGFYNNDRVLYDATFVQTETVTGFEMFTNGSFPMLFESTDDKQIHGELFFINAEAFQRCDYLEGYPRHYNRKQIQTEKGLAWVYFYNTGFAERQHYLKKIENGDFRQWQTQKYEKEIQERKNEEDMTADPNNTRDVEESVIYSTSS